MESDSDFLSALLQGGLMSRQMMIDLPLGTHRINLEFWRKGGSTGIKSSMYNVTVRRADKGMDGWDLPLDVCEISLLCRTLREFDLVMKKEQQSYWLTYYTLLGMESWGWFTPWRGVHRYDAGVAVSNPTQACHTPKRTCVQHTDANGSHVFGAHHSLPLLRLKTDKQS